MFKEAGMLFIFTETPVHAGTGRGLGGIDLPIQRERVTGYPMIQASSLKGRMRAEARAVFSDNKVEVLFGPEKISSAGDAKAGALSFGDARILLFPVRSLFGLFVWITCPHVLARFYRDWVTVGKAQDFPNEVLNLQPADNTVIAAPDSGFVRNEKADKSGDPAKVHAFLEEQAFQVEENEEVRNMAKWVAQNALPEDPVFEYWRKLLTEKGHLAIVSDETFQYFVQMSTEVATRVRLDPDTKTVKKGLLWTEEYLPSDTLLYAPVFGTPRGQSHNPVQDFQDLVGKLARTVLGGDETIGRGMVSLRFL